MSATNQCRDFIHKIVISTEFYSCDYEQVPIDYSPKNGLSGNTMGGKLSGHEVVSSQLRLSEKQVEEFKAFISCADDKLTFIIFITIMIKIKKLLNIVQIPKIIEISV